MVFSKSNLLPIPINLHFGVRQVVCEIPSLAGGVRDDELTVIGKLRQEDLGRDAVPMESILEHRQEVLYPYIWIVLDADMFELSCSINGLDVDGRTPAAYEDCSNGERRLLCSRHMKPLFVSAVTWAVGTLVKLHEHPCTGALQELNSRLC
jgi:hypothetical protein